LGHEYGVGFRLFVDEEGHNGFTAEQCDAVRFFDRIDNTRDVCDPHR
jgi:hypothetical protein